jgi:hypothetical protein
MISGKGYPDRATKVLVRYLAKTEEIPVFLLTDCDPNGIAIALQYDGATERIGVPLHGPENAGFAALRLLVDHDHSLLKQLQRRITCMDGIGASLQPPLAWMAATGYKSEIESLSNPDLTEFVIRALKQRLKVYSVHKWLASARPKCPLRNSKSVRAFEEQSNANLRTGDKLQQDTKVFQLLSPILAATKDRAADSAGKHDTRVAMPKNGYRLRCCETVPASSCNAENARNFSLDHRVSHRELHTVEFRVEMDAVALGPSLIQK